MAFKISVGSTESISKLKKKTIILLFCFILPYSLMAYSELDENEDEIREIFDTVILRVLEKANLSSGAVVGILPSYSVRTNVKPSYLGIMESSMEVILSSRVKLADRSKLKEIDTETEIKKTKGIESLIGSKTAQLKGIDFFIWAKFTPASKGKTNIKVHILDTTTGIFRGIASKTYAIAPALKIDEQVDVNTFYRWEESYRSAENLSDVGYIVFLTGLGTVAVGILTAPCQEKSTKDDKEYDNMIECNREEGGTFYNAMMTFGIFSLLGGGVTWMLGDGQLEDAIEEGEKQNFPTLAVAPISAQGRIGMQIRYRF